MKIVSETIQNATGQVYFRTVTASDLNVSLSDIRGDVSTRTLPYDEYMSLLGGSVKKRDEKKWVKIPDNFIPGSKEAGLITGYLTDKGWSCVWRVKGTQRQFVHKSGHYRIPFPDLLFYVRKAGGYLRYVWAIDEKDNIYQYPFGNVDTSGSICMGNISLEDCDTFTDFTEEFFLGKTNNDYFHPGNHVKVMYGQDELLRRLDGKDKFPKKWLIKRNLTLSDVKKMAEPGSRYDNYDY